MLRRAPLTFTCFALLALLSSTVFAQSTGRFPDPPAAQPPAPPGPRPIDRRPPEPMIPGASATLPPRRPTPAAPLVQAVPSGTFLPPVLPYRDGAPIPSGYRLVTEPNSGLVLGGLLIELAGYTAAFAIGAANDFDNGAGWLVVPVIGPWAALGARENPCAGIAVENATLSDAECVNEALDEAKLIAFLTVDGMIQMVGASLMIVGAATPHRELVRADVAGFRLRPVRFARGGWGLTAHTEF